MILWMMIQGMSDEPRSSSKASVLSERLPRPVLAHAMDQIVDSSAAHNDSN